jgi:hypothetical protein
MERGQRRGDEGQGHLTRAAPLDARMCCRPPHCAALTCAAAAPAQTPPCSAARPRRTAR